MKRKLLLVTASAFMAFGAISYAGSHILFSESPIVARAEGELTIEKGPNGYYETINVGDQVFDCYKASTSKAAGHIYVTIPAGTTTLRFYGAAWKGSTCSLSITSNDGTINKALSLPGNDGVANNSPYTFSGDLTDDYRFEVSFEGISADTLLDFTSATRFVIWNVYALQGEAKSDAQIEIEKLSTKAQLGFNYSVESESNYINGEEYVANSKGFTNAQLLGEIEYDSYIQMAFSKGTGSTAPAYYNTGAAMRLYPGNTLEFSSDSASIRRVELSFDGSNTGTLTMDGYSLANGVGTWEGNSNSVVFTNKATSGHARIKTVKVYYDGLTRTYTYSNIAMNFGGMCEVTKWNALDNENEISICGVAVARTSKLGINSIEELVEADNTSIIKTSEGWVDEVARVDADGITENDNGDYYIWSANMNIPYSMINESITAVSYMILDDGTYVFLKQAEYSVKTLAAAYKTKDLFASLDPEVKGAIRALAD